MEQPIIKICGLQSLEAAKHAVDSGAKYLGVICVPNRKRTVRAEVAREISELVHSSDSHVKLVGVFRNQSKEDILETVRDYQLDIVQLHGDEAWREYRQFLGIPIIKRMIFPRDCDEVLKSSNEPDFLCLFDSEAGGTGEMLNWEAINQWATDTGVGTRFILAGGLTPENVEEALKISGVIGIDVSGGVESNNEKDLNKISRFVNNAMK
ncbi:hypothetical protein HG535_0C02440 [Zygotorulaspora mrakii]|uniref:N-(5'-phosphoribosyl)anthranilate isomerase n=1 Tax=Zygotorulaspora mrakii TaxID=42260 RepID=A0A7H9B0L1_ZYGMR|nr:uncharacterized protein HG535_0C02440 [Zygotorulaspora mrakii]QLG71894.1 hypothetical protein HG535_0C02440 [Zygotorulaspora mrakii]